MIFTKVLQLTIPCYNNTLFGENDVEKLVKILYDISLNFKYLTLGKTSGSFDEANKLLLGGFGTVDKGVLAYGREVAVKRLFFNKKHRVADSYNEVNIISSIAHKNLARLLGYNCSGPESLLVYEFLHNHSLNRFIFDSKLWANIADFGLARSFQEDKSHLSIAIAVIFRSIVIWQQQGPSHPCFHGAQLSPEFMNLAFNVLPEPSACYGAGQNGNRQNPVRLRYYGASHQGSNLVSSLFQVSQRDFTALRHQPSSQLAISSDTNMSPKGTNERIMGNQSAPQPIQADSLDEHVSHAEFRTTFTTLADSVTSQNK
ncbi:putative cysteine-rich receptor-like protein kinase 2-like isoform X1 [Capsicum annuum]|nr:putative cysteine-rich receptor-like protein kinase 2-like isoform X1 [Capsicum annuum]KAF3621770.1 putative cysteine-rich receptor-like protein kinase 2-like isoform X1 [Capsicum annuum]